MTTVREKTAKWNKYYPVIDGVCVCVCVYDINSTHNITKGNNLFLFIQKLLERLSK